MYDGSTIRLYKNGVLVQTFPNVSYDIAESKIIIGGQQLNGNFRSFNGYIASIRIYDRVLNDAEILKLYNEFHPTTSH